VIERDLLEPAPAKRVERLGREGDLRDEDDRLAAAADGFEAGMEVDGGLAAPVTP